jgi:hypothetical protein
MKLPNSNQISQPGLSYSVLKLFLTAKKTDRGTALVIAIMLGLLFMVLGAVAIAQSSLNKTNASIDEAAQQSKNITEGGINNLIASLNKASVKSLLLLNYDPNGYLGCTSNCNQWNETTTALQYTAYNSCDDGTVGSAISSLPVYNSAAEDKLAGEVSLGSTGKYEILGYKFDQTGTNPISGNGTLFIKGRVVDSSNSANSSAKSLLQVQFPVKVKTDNQGSGSAILASEINIQQSAAVVDTITCTDPVQCPVSCTTGASAPTFDQLSASIGASSDHDLLTDISTTDADTTPKVLVGTMSIPSIPAVPVGVTVYDLANVTSNITLPQTGETTSTGPEGPTYYYQIANWDKSAITINTTDHVRLYVSGYIDRADNDDLRLSDASAEPSLGQIRLYGGFSNGNPPVGNHQDWGFGGNSCTMAFIHAPYADVDVNAGGNACSGLPSPCTGTNIFGALWVKSYNVTGIPSSTPVLCEQPGLMAVVGAGYGNVGFQSVSLSPVTQWSPKADSQ